MFSLTARLPLPTPTKLPRPRAGGLWAAWFALLIGTVAPGAAADAAPAKATSAGPSARAKGKAKAPPKDTASIKITKVVKTDEGTTLFVAMDHGPFPAAGRPYTNNTTLVFVPKFFRSTGSVDMLVHFHGHHGMIEQKMVDHDLREQVFESGRNIVIAMPQGPENATDSSGGKLERRGAFQKFVQELIAVLRSPKATQELGAAALPRKARHGAIAISSHSGGYKVTAAILRHGGIAVKEIYLFDSLYGDVATYADWISAKVRGRKLISWYVVETPARLNKQLIAKLRAAKVRVAHETNEGTLSRGQLMNGRAVFIRTEIQHGRTPYKHHNLREALFASGFRAAKGRPATDWYQRLKGPRPVEQRKP